MVKDDHDQEGRSPHEAGGVDLRLAAVLLTAAVALAVAAAFGVHLLQSGSLAGDSSKDSDGTPPVFARLHLFQGWNPAPDVTLLLSGQEHGYLQPCGCSNPQRGGLVRRYNLLQALKQRGWPVVPLDLGDVAQSSGPRDLPNVQGLIKYRTSMEILRQMGYLAVGLGESDGSLPLKEALDNYALNNPEPPVLCANLKDKASIFPDEVQDSAVATVPGSGLKLAVTLVVGPTVKEAMRKDPQVQFDKVPEVLPAQLAKMKAARADLRLLLYQGFPEEARKLAANYPEFDVVVCQSEDDEGPAQAEPVGKTCLVRGVGHKGKNVGVLGVWRTGNPQQPFTFRYQHVMLGEAWQTPEAQMNEHPVARRMEVYTQELKDNHYLTRYGQSNHPLQVSVPGVVPKYVGSARCSSCHDKAYQVWKNSKHAEAYQTLVNARHPSLRQYDGECVVCHVTGFTYKSGFTDLERTPKLKDVGCEACHGPGSSHSNDPQNPKWYRLMNPWKAKPNETAAEKSIRELEINKACMRCHDPENDVNWDFDKKWPKIVHHSE
jgi:hypothetical protein